MSIWRPKNVPRVPKAPNAPKEHLEWTVLWFPDFWCTLHLVAVSFSLSWHKPKLGSQFLLFSSPSPYLPLLLPHKAIMKTKLIICFKTWTESFGVVGERSSKPQMAQGTFLCGSAGPPAPERTSPVCFTPRRAALRPSSPTPRSPLPRRPPLPPSSPAPTLRLCGALAVCCAESFYSLQAGQIRAVCSYLNPPWCSG